MDLFTAEIAWFTPSKVYLQRTTNYLEQTGRAIWLPRVPMNSYLACMLFYHGYNYDEANSSVSLSSLRIPFLFPCDPTANLALDSEAEHAALARFRADGGVHGRDAPVDDDYAGIVPGRARVLEAPFTEFVYITIRRGHDIDYHLRLLVLVLKQEPEKIDAHVASCWGRSVDCADVVVGLIGWEDVHGSAHMSRLLSRIAELSSVERKLARLKIALAHE